MAFPSPDHLGPRGPKEYFVSNQIGFFVRNNDNTDSILEADSETTLQAKENLVRDVIRDAIAPIEFDDNERGFLNFALDIGLNFTHLPGLSAVFTHGDSNNPLSEIELLELIKKVNRVVYQPEYVSEQVGKIVPSNGKSFQLLAALPNWLSGAQQSKPVGTGGPGGIPTPAEIKASVELGGATGSEIHDQLEPQAANTGMRAVKTGTEKHPAALNIYILDTAPPAQRVIDKWALYKDTNELVPHLFGENEAPQLNGNDLISSSGFTIHYSTQFDEQYYLPGHHYDVSDHGLFIASLIDQQYPVFYNVIKNPAQLIMPGLNIHLIEVLSQYGVGTMETFLWGLAKTITLQTGSTNPAVVNCSWVLAAPIELEHMAHLIEDGMRLTDLEAYLVSEVLQAKSRQLLSHEDYTEFISFAQGIQAMHQHLSDLKQNRKACIFACAGNDGKEGQSRAKARYPAAFTEVVGITALALPDSNVTASYANIADDPSGTGFAIWGGETTAVQAGSETIYFSDPHNSPVGLYFNDGYPNEWGVLVRPAQSTGLAHWSGTSFATPLAAATFAASLAHRWTGVGNDFQNAESAVRGTQADTTATYNEKTIPLTV